MKKLSISHNAISVPTALAVIGALATGILAALIRKRRETAALIRPQIDRLKGFGGLIYCQARRGVIFVFGSAVLLIGLAMIVLPGPALLIIPLGLTILAIEFTWAQRWLQSIRQTVTRLHRRARLFVHFD